MASVAVIGPGAIGGIVAAWLGKSGRHELTLCARRAFAGLHVETPAGALDSRPRLVTAPTEATGPADWILVCTKAYDTAGAAAWLRPLVGPATRVAILQNGVEHRERFAPHVPAAQLLPVMVDIPAERDSPGRIRQRANGRMVVEDSPAGREFVALFAGGVIDVTTTPDFRSVAWRKLCLNSAGVLNALLLQPAGIFHDDAIADLGRAVVRECVAVGRAAGATLADGLPDAVIDTCRRSPRDSVNSMHADRAAGRPMEIDARNGVIVRLGRRHGIPTPCNAMAVTLLEKLAAPDN